MSSDAQLAKEQGNEAFKAGKYTAALELYTKAMKLDPADLAFPLNRAMANLKLKRWSDAERDATFVLELEDDNLKAYWRRCTARRELGNFTGARQDLWAYFNYGGEPQNLMNEHIRISHSEVEAMLSSTRQSTSHLFKVQESEGKGLGAFATRTFLRGDLIFAERPLYNIPRSEWMQGVKEVLSNIPPSKRREFMTLQDSGAIKPPEPGTENEQVTEMLKILSIQDANNNAAGADNIVVGLKIARFNYSCVPNAKYSWHDETRTMRLYALRTIVKGEEICYSLLARDDLYGATRKERREKLLHARKYMCMCDGCTLPRAESLGSDRRRKELARTYETMKLQHEAISKPWEIKNKLLEIANALQLLREDGLVGDKDDFSCTAASLCVFHADYESVRYWAAMTYEARASEYGGDSWRALGTKEPQVRELLVCPETDDLAGKGEVYSFADVRV